MVITDEILEAVDFLAIEGKTEDRDLTRDRILLALNTQLYGPIFGEMVKYGKQHVENGHFDPHAMAGGLEIAADLYFQSDYRYWQQENTLSPEELATHHREVLLGNLTTVDPKVGMTIPNSVAQVIAADIAYCGDVNDIGFQAAVGGANYGALFKDQTMTSGSRINEKLDGSNSPYETPPDAYNAMNHLDKSNAIIACIVEGIVRSVNIGGNKQRIRMFDIGSGHGGTISQVMHRIKHQLGDNNLPEIAVTALEATPHFYDELIEFLNGNFGAQSIGLDVNELAPYSSAVSEFGSVSAVRANAPRALKDMDTSGMGGNDEIIVVFANYVFHRLPSDKKTEIMQKFAEMENVIFIVGDLVQNTSFINVNHFNIAGNGPQNNGNRKTPQSFAKEGYVLVETGYYLPAAVVPQLAANVPLDSIDPGHDGHLFLAHKGNTDMALSLIHNVTPVEAYRALQLA